MQQKPPVLLKPDVLGRLNGNYTITAAEHTYLYYPDGDRPTTAAGDHRNVALKKFSHTLYIFTNHVP